MFKPPPDNYPFDRSDEEIEGYIRECSVEMKSMRHNTNGVIRLNALVQLGQNELQKRSNQEFLKTTSEASFASQRFARRAIGISVVAMVLSFVTAFLAYRDARSDQQWQDEQLEILRNIESNALPGS